MIVISEAARQRIKKVMSEDQSSVFKISLSPKGCSGFAYVMGTGPSVDESWEVSRCGDLDVAVPKKDLAKLGDIEVDWIKDGMSSRLSIENPQVVNACGCGSSFMFKP